ncbi:hypothetical protein BDP27DRAFT_1339691, partial [Rhodocollybia butyracea]
MEEKIMAGCNNLIQHTLTEVSASAIAQFQERAEILMEREIVGPVFVVRKPKLHCSRCWQLLYH